MFINKIRVNYCDLGHIGWRYYNEIKKKAVEQEFSWSGLALSLSIAFFIVVICAQGLNLSYQSIEANKRFQQLPNQKIYFLEQINQLNIQDNSDFLRNIPTTKIT
ncbi:MAG: hypothetical protein ABH818_01025 [Patescibacteria group bacterium]|nr:hypothetical protein [Patescibacteria group bacterium]MBU1870516.1 hypothetical protein [Patescibacteria group bacterium]